MGDEHGGRGVGGGLVAVCKDTSKETGLRSGMK